MAIIPVDSVDDPRIAVYRDLKLAFAKRRQFLFVVEGLVLTERLLASDIRVDSVLAEQRHVDRLQPQMPEDAPLFVAQRELMEEVAGFKFHRGVLGCGRRPFPVDLPRTMQSAPPRSIITVCVGIRDPENLGSVVRCSAAFGVHAVMLGPSCCDPFYRRVARTSMGANMEVPIVESADLRADLLSLRRKFDVRLIATVLDEGAQPLNDSERPDRVALLFGSEGFGLEQPWVEMCDDRVTIPMSRLVDSLNVSVAAGIFLHHFSSPSSSSS
ncbi:MAG: RNA methyltransferase [Planctomycetes bacterium]|nr:RNA methyltransferase [Planctomycetota bacterium]MBL7040344.1 RNA methyltransferase [Pirellulaceae bacterium]